MFFTDGAMDRYDSGTRGVKEQLAAVGSSKDLKADELANRMEEFVSQRCPARWAEDLALLVLRVAE